MNLHDFLDFNHNCPLCGNKLTLYLNTNDGLIRKAVEQDNKYVFHDQYTDFILYKKKLNIKFHTVYDETNHFKSSSQFFFFFICNEKCVEQDPYTTKYNVDLSLGCYYRASQWFKLNKKTIVLEHQYLDCVNSYEIFTFNTFQDNGGCKRYILSMNYEESFTHLDYTHISELRNDPMSYPIFSKTLPLLKQLPDLHISKRQQLINKFDTWILFS